MIFFKFDAFFFFKTCDDEPAVAVDVPAGSPRPSWAMWTLALFFGGSTVDLCYVARRFQRSTLSDCSTRGWQDGDGDYQRVENAIRHLKECHGSYWLQLKAER